MNFCLSSQLNNISMRDNALYDFVIYNPSGAHVKDAKTGMYMMGNKRYLEVLGLEKIEQIIGLDIFGVEKLMPYWGKEYVEKIQKLDFTVKTEKKVQVIENDILLTANNQISIQTLVKVPLLNSHNQTTALLTIFTDKTREFDLFTLFDLYIKSFPDKITAIFYFSKFLGLDNYFHKQLTCKEIKCVLHMLTNRSYKNLAGKLGIGLKTVETHVSHMISKSKSGQLTEALSYLRDKKY